jgi:DNA-directed RNA polymerase specialized sigma24 family protein
MKTTWLPTQESFERLLAWLDLDREKAAQKYEMVRNRLIKYFVCNGCGDDAEDLADKTFDRVMGKLEEREIPEPFTGDKPLYFLAFAKNIRRERYNDLRPRPVMVISKLDDELTKLEDEDFCLEKCAKGLELEDRWLAIEYYNFEKATKVVHHRMLAEQLSLSLHGLRTRIYRVRERLRPCIEKCLERQAVQ